MRWLFIVALIVYIVAMLASSHKWDPHAEHSAEPIFDCYAR